MTRDAVNFHLRMMEQIRENSYEAETKAEEKRLIREYKQIWEAIKPYVNGEIPYSEPSTPPSTPSQ